MHLAILFVSLVCYTRARDVDVNDAGNFLFSANLQDEAAVLGWDGEAALDFSLLFSAPPEPTCKYTDIPKKFTWDSKNHAWKRRKRVPSPPGREGGNEFQA